MMIKNYRARPGLSWMHGQGSVFSRFTDDSDLDFVIGWDVQLPERPSLPAELSSRLSPYGDVVLEQTTTNGYDLDVMHLPRAAVDSWLGQLDAGQGWRGLEWPLPIYAASGLAHGVVLLDPEGTAGHLQDQLRHPPGALVDAVRSELATALPRGLAELDHCSDRGDHWLHQNLSVPLIKIIYTGWFVAEGHLPPFPKRLPSWFDRLQMDPVIIRLERACWGRSSIEATTSAIATFGTRVLDLLQSKSSSGRAGTASD